MLRKIDPISLEVIRNRLSVIADEMEVTLLKSSFSPVIKEALDASAALFDNRGRTVSQSLAIPAQLGMIMAATECIVNAFPSEAMQPGDIYILNDPFDGGTHLPDIAVIEPVFVDGQLVGLAGSLAHHQDVGGKTPGSTPPDAVDVYAEGLIIPPMKLYDRGTPNHTLLRMMRRNSRTPDAFMGDIDAQIAANKVGSRGFVKLCREFGTDLILKAIDDLFDYSEKLTRDEIEKIPDGTYEFYDFLDHDGVDFNTPVKIQAAVTVDGSSIQIDFQGSSPQVRGGLNSVPASTNSAVFYVIRAITGADIPNNAGCFRPVTTILPLGSVLNPFEPAAVSVRAITLKRVVDVLLGCFAQAMPDRIHAASCGVASVFQLGGRDPQNGRPYVTWQGIPIAGGMGARPSKDGIDVIDTDVTNVMREPIEATEMDFPVRVHELCLWTDSGGAGTFRGGLGYYARTELLRGMGTLVVRRDRHEIAPWGLNGGYSAPVCRATLVHSGERTDLPSKIVLPMNAGDQLEVFTTGGAGYGDPLDRSPHTVLEDVIDRRVSREAARDVYGVIFRECDSGLDVDEVMTSTCRVELKMQRGTPTWSFDRGAEFEHKFGLPRYQ